MSKTPLEGMAFQQKLSFSAPFKRLSKGSDSVFWPGCALMTMEPRLLYKTLEILRREKPGMGLSSCCCGQPSMYLFPEEYPQREESLQKLIDRRGIRHIYTACPNCGLQLSRLKHVEIHPIWTALAKHLRPEDLSPPLSRCTLHDPCPMRKELEQQQAVRQLMALAGCECVEAAFNGPNTVCCGNIRMLKITHPEKSAALRQNRISHFDKELPVCSYCQGCLRAFASEGMDTVHMLELLFGKSETKGWSNRLKFTFGKMP